VKRPTQEELLEALRRNTSRPDIVVQRLAQDLVTQRADSDHQLDDVGCIFDSGAGRCDGSYQHLHRLHYRLEGDEVWESPW
jgi:hypothetical protein